MYTNSLAFWTVKSANDLEKILISAFVVWLIFTILAFRALPIKSDKPVIRIIAYPVRLVAACSAAAVGVFLLAALLAMAISVVSLILT